MELRAKVAFDTSKAASNTVRLSVHVRRGDVSSTRHSKRFTSNDTIAARLHLICQTIHSAGRKPELHIHSQGKKEDFGSIATIHECRFHLDEDPIQTIKSLATSDITVISKSSFSYLAGIISKGLVLYEKFWHSPLPSWCNIDDVDTIHAIRQQIEKSMP
jgi:hypothetical protein